jgi:Trk-type K+ transport system membrane component
MRRNFHPAALLVGSFAMIVLAGALLLLMPRAATQPLSVLDALFTSTSAVCVTGLTVVDTATQFTPLGHGILLFLIQAGGLGIMTLTTVLGLLIGGSGGLREYATLQTLLGEESIGRIRRTLWTVTLATLAFEAAGALVLYQLLDPAVAGTGSHAVFFAVFHSVSAFCNAGFALTSEGLTHPLLRANATVLATVMILVVVGGIGFPVMSNVGRIVWSRLTRRPFRGHLSLQSKIVLWTTCVLLVVGTVALFMVERGFGQSSTTMGERWLTAAFHSVVARTAGFNTIEVASMSLPGLFVLMVLMWIGGSPGSTAGGVKTTAVAVALLNIRAIVTGADRVEAFRTTVSGASIVRAFSTILLSVAVIATLVFLLLLTDPVSFDGAVFEVISAVGTVGLTTGITPSLSYGGKLVIIAGMFIGRVGVLSFAIAMTGQWQRRRAEYPAENVLVT